MYLPRRGLIYFPKNEAGCIYLLNPEDEAVLTLVRGEFSEGTGTG